MAAKGRSVMELLGLDHVVTEFCRQSTDHVRFELL
jgi:hypothetical protein